LGRKEDWNMAAIGTVDKEGWLKKEMNKII